MMPSAPPRALSALDTVVDDVLVAALASLGPPAAMAHALAGLDVVDLPPVGGGAADAESIAFVAPLYLAAQLEASGLVAVAETVAGLVVAGGFGAGLSDGAADAAVGFWRGRRDRLEPAEREEFFARVFGELPGLPATSGSGTDFELALIALADAMVSAPAAYSGARERIGVCASGRVVGDVVAGRTSGTPSVVALDLIGVVQESLTLLKEPTVLAALGARTVWGGVQQAQRRYRLGSRPVAVHVGIGRDGVALLGWLGRVWPELSAGGCSDSTGPEDEVLVAASSWLRSSLALHEAVAPGRESVPAAR